MNIPEEAVIALYHGLIEEGVELPYGARVGDYLASLRAALSAAAPTLMAMAWDECMATIDDNAWIDWTVETPPANPYRADELEGK